MILFALIFVMVLGAVALGYGFAGGQIDDHPLCRKCGFDLTGKPETSTVCAECGADLGARRAIVIGHRRRYRGCMVLGVFLLLGGGAGAGLATQKSIDLYAHSPDWLLQRLMESTSPSTRTAALAELGKRLTTNKLTQPRLDSIADRILALQADRKIAWSAGWGDLLEGIYRAGLLSDQRWQRYASGTLTFNLLVRSRVRLGDPLFFRVETNAGRGARRSSLSYQFANEWVQLGPLGREWYGRDYDVGVSSGALPKPVSMFLTSPPYVIDQLQPGATTFRAVRRIEIGDYQRRKVFSASEVAIQAPVTLLPPDEPSVRLVRNDALAPAIRRSLHADEVRLSPYPDGLHIKLRIDAPPADVAFEVFMQAHASDPVKLGCIACAKDARGSCEFKPPGIYAILGDQIELIFRPSPDAAVATIDLFDIWDGEIKLSGLEVRRRASADVYYR